MKLTRKGNTLQGIGISYLIAERKHITPSKPPYFLLQKQPSEKYISSLYGEFPTFELEYRGKWYQLSLTDSAAILSPIEGGGHHV